MGQVRDIMAKNVVTIQQDKTALDAARILTEKDVSFLVIVKAEKPVGIVTEKDFVKKLVAQNKSPSEVPLSEIMSYKYRSVAPTTEIEDAIQKMLNHKIRRLLVIDNGELVGAITQTDLASFLRSKLLIDGTMKDLEANTG